MSFINYEELYPTHVPDPKPATSNQLHSPGSYHNSHSNTLSPQTASSYTVSPRTVINTPYSEYPESVPPMSSKGDRDGSAYAGGYTHYPEVVPLGSSYSTEKEFNAPQDSPPPKDARRYCGLSRKVFLIVLAVALVVVIAAVGGGVGASISAKNKNKENETTSSTIVSGTDCGGSSSCLPSATSSSTVSATSSSSSSSQTSSSGTSSGTSSSSTAKETIGAIAAASFEHDEGTTNKTFVFVFQQQGSKITYEMDPGSGTFGSPQEVALKVAPKNDTPIAATSYEVPNAGSKVNLFYLDIDNNVMTVSLYGALTDTSLTVNTSQIAQAGLNVHPSSSLAALWLGAAGFRVYYQTTANYLQEVTGTDTKWKAGAVLSKAAAAKGSPLAASMVTVAKINLFYVGASDLALYNINYSAGWGTPSLVTSASVPTWDGSSTSLAAAGEDGSPSYLRTYYIGKDKSIWEYYSSTSAAWGNVQNVQPGHSSVWTPSDTTNQGSLAAIGWGDQVRLYYVNNGKVVQAALSGTKWTM